LIQSRAGGVKRGRGSSPAKIKDIRDFRDTKDQQLLFLDVPCRP